MKRLLSLLTVFFAFVHARAEVLTTYELPEGPVPPLAKEGSVWVGCYYCSAIKGRIIEQLVNAATTSLTTGMRQPSRLMSCP